jgi:hypothetical protein
MVNQYKILENIHSSIFSIGKGKVQTFICLGIDKTKANEERLEREREEKVH